MNGNKNSDALLSDICISTSVAPLYLPAYKFTNDDVEFNMIDGGVAANNSVKCHTVNNNDNNNIWGQVTIYIYIYQYYLA